ncbi:hypothetical protein [Desulfatiglans anilini]|uniref:hypothetical protein n=1 Tax=Desulfatiglans anilini TaxID=90728 RepID=UPI0004166564|nr:hypothetical protein [Desulfatiglans anilini]
MADDLQDLGGFPIFPLEPDWTTEPELDPMLIRDLRQYTGTVQGLDAIMDPAAFRLRAGFGTDKDEEYELLDFFVGRLGRLKKFWLKGPKTAFTLQAASAAGASHLWVHDNGFLQLYQGYERIYIEAHGGDLITRKITGITDDREENSRLQLLFAMGLDREITPTNHYRIGMLYLVRFETDALKLEFMTSHLADAEGRFTELVQEYPS